MSARLLVFLLWVALVLTGCIGASFYAWSPYSAEQRAPRAAGAYGPTHK